MREMMNTLSDSYDIVVGEYRIFDENTKQLREDPVHRLGDLPSCDGTYFVMNYQRRASAVIWRCIYKRELILSLSFHEGVRFEDVEWSMDCYSSAKSIICRDIYFYTYRIRGGSTTSSPANAATLSDAKVICRSMLDKAAHIESPDIRKRYEIEALHCALYIALRSRRSLSRKDKQSFRRFLRDCRISSPKYSLISAFCRLLFLL